MRSLLFLLATFSISAAAAPSYQECLLDRLPGAQNDTAARQAIMVCRQSSPDGHGEPKAGWLGPQNADECRDKYLNKTPSNLAAKHLWVACTAVYPAK